ncbi:sigma-70 family RNA polymerase sigma factor [uncultured Aeromicrobium sp.]|uniref:sigma-70 family RNA polymerase sigma factor n=1 Tax=uncultured Aeromicrobium sp. TaxID=337820 RepID=UPI0025FAD633|nr:sigma-70 family RNA polymerase sigma factor [uncultured Aeromicrobium sp.]
MSAATTTNPTPEVVWREELVTRHIALAKSLANRYTSRGVEHEDLRQVALVGLVRAAHRYDPSRGPFAAFAAPTILGEIKHHFRDAEWTIRPPRRLQELQARVNVARADLEAEAGGEVDLAEIAGCLGEDIEEVRAAASVHHCFSVESTDASGRETVAEVHGEEDANFTRVEDVVSLAPLVSTLDPDDRELLRLRFVDELSQRQIARILGTSQMQVCRRLRRLLARLREDISA